MAYKGYKDIVNALAIRGQSRGPSAVSFTVEEEEEDSAGRAGGGTGNSGSAERGRARQGSVHWSSDVAPARRLDAYDGEEHAGGPSSSSSGAAADSAAGPLVDFPGVKV